MPDGYQMERFKGESLGTLIRQELDKDFYKHEFTTQQKLQRVISKEQAQELLDRIAEFHKGTKRVHGDLGHMDDVIIDNQGKLRLTDPEWERIADQTPSGELQGVYDYLTKEGGFTDLVLPETISDEEARLGLAQFIDEVKQKVKMDPVIGFKVLKVKDSQVEIKTSEAGDIFVKQI